MYVEMTCACEASLMLDDENTDSIWFMVFRFANAHVECGYMTKAVSDEPGEAKVTKKRVIKPRRDDDDEEP